MPRDNNARANEKTAKARRAFALARGELVYPSVPRTAPDGPTSAPIKARDAENDRLIAEFEARGARR